MEHGALIGLAAIVVLGIFAQWLAWRLKLPAILLLLITGFMVGPVTGFIHPDHLFGEALFPAVSVAVALILFEGGLDLRFSRIADVGDAVLRMVTLGVGLTWVMATLSAWLILGFRFDLALLFGAILVVTGPTVIIPLMRHVRPKPRVGALIRWEGIVNDPIGAVLAVLVFEGILAGGFGTATIQLFQGLAVTMVVGAALAGVGALILIVALKRYWVPDFLENPVTLALVIAVFTAANQVQAECGLVAVTLMGIILANQNIVKVGHIIEFKENLRVLLLATLFIVLAARVDMATISQINIWSGVFLAALIIVVRPLSIFGSTIGTDLDWKTRLYIGLMAPRGIVAAAVASIFTFELTELGIPQAEQLLSETFLVITGTVAIYGLASKALADWLDLSQSDAQGVVIAGSHSWALEIAQSLDTLGYPVEIIAQDPMDVVAAHRAGIRARHGSAASHELVEHLDLSGYGTFLALTATDEVNLLGSLEFAEAFGRENAFHLAPRSAPEEEGAEPAAARQRGRVVFGQPMDYDKLNGFFRRGGELRIVAVTDGGSFGEFCERQDEAFPMFYVRNGQLQVCSTDAEYTPQTGDTIVCAVRPAGSDER